MMPISVGQIQSPETGINIYINNVDYSGYALNYRYVKEDNQIQEFSINLLGISETQRSTDVKQDIVVRFESKGQLLFKGIIERVEYQTSGSVDVIGYGAGESLAKRQLADVTSSSSPDSPPLRPIYEDVSVETLLSEQLSSISGVTVDSVDTGAELDMGTFRADHISILNLAGNTVTSKGGKWWFSHGNTTPFEENIFHASTFRGSASSVKTFNIAGVEQNASVTGNEKDFENLFNWTEVLGTGDGINQKRSVNFHATTNRTYLASDIDATQSTIPVVDSSTLPVSGAVWVGMEKLYYTSKSGNNLLGSTRGVVVSENPTNDANTVAIYYCNEGTGSTVSSGKINFNATWVGTPSWSESTAIQGFSIGPFTDANYVTVSGALSQFSPTNVGSVEFWFYPTEANRRQQLIRQSASSSGSDQFQVEISSANKIVSQINTQSGSPPLISKSSVTLNNWHHVMIRSDGGTHRLYYDGVLEVIENSSVAFPVSVAVSGVYFGVSNESSAYFNGFFDNIVIHDAALTPNLATSNSYAHSKGIEVYDTQYTISNPQSGSSISTYGLKQHSFQDKTIINQDTLDRVAQEELASHKDLVTRLTLTPSNPYDTLRTVDINDAITVVDSDSDLDGEFKVHSITAMSDNGYEQVELECSNAKLTLSEELKENRRLSDVESRFMQGSTALITVNETENAESGSSEPGPIDVFFEIPQEAVAINQIKLAYRNEKPRVWNDVSSASTSASTSNPTIEGRSGSLSPTTSSDWKDVASFSLGSNVSVIIGSVNLQRTAGAGSSDVYIRFSNTTAGTTYPVASGSSSAFYQFQYDDAAASSAAGGGTPLYWLNPGTAADTIKLQIASDGGSDTWVVDYHISIVPTHTHSIDYNIIQKTYTTTAIKVHTSDDADGTPSWTERTANISGALGRTLHASDEEVETNIDLTPYFTGTGFKGVRLETNGNSRHKVQLTAKVFVEAKKVS